MAEDVTSIPSSKLRGSLAEILRRIDDGESFVITHYDRAVAILSPAEVVPAPVQAAATAALAPGWVAVPVEPKRAMWAASGDALYALNRRLDAHHDTISEAVWKAMIAAAPPPPLTGEGGE